jgi:ribosomal protein S18 acetylase RimI-like enzyme
MPRLTGAIARMKRGTAGSPVIRRGTPADTDALAALVREREGGDLADHLRGARAELAGERPQNVLLIAELHGMVAGFGRIRFLRPALEDAAPHPAPDGWYLAGLIVAPERRRQGIGAALTRERLAWIAERADEAFYFASASNRASIALHRRFGFVEVTRTFSVPGVRFERGDGVLFRVALDRAEESAGPPSHA